MSVLSHLVLQFSSHPENLATEALAYILDRSSSAKRGLNRFVTALTGRTLNIERIDTQSSNPDSSRPDLCGLDSAGRKTLLIEVKFWAGLTEAQPTGYLAAMSEPGVLLFVSPAARLEILWSELRSRLQAENAQLAPRAADFRREGFALDAFNHVVTATSWRLLLNFLEQEAFAGGEPQIASDIRQLQALCDKMDTDAFLPLASEELSSSIGRRVLQFERLADDLTNRLVNHGTADVTNLRAAAGWGYCGRYLRLKGILAFLGFSPNSWASLGQSPVWLEIGGEVGRPPTTMSVKNALGASGIDSWERENKICVPIRLPSGVERDRVLLSGEQQLVAIAAVLPDTTA